MSVIRNRSPIAGGRLGLGSDNETRLDGSDIVPSLQLDCAILIMYLIYRKDLPGSLL
jgi:hypothetical protein